MIHFSGPSNEVVSQENKALFEVLRSTLGFVPNIYAVLTYSGNAFGNYLYFKNWMAIFSNWEKKLVNLVVCGVNGCWYCQRAHSVLA